MRFKTNRDIRVTCDNEEALAAINDFDYNLDDLFRYTYLHALKNNGQQEEAKSQFKAFYLDKEITDFDKK